MKKTIAMTLYLAVSTSFASNYPEDYCHARVMVCEDGPGIVARVSSGCSTELYVIGYKKKGQFGKNSFVDSVVNFKFGNYSTVKGDFRITPDWNHTGFITSGINPWTVVGRSGTGPILEISVAFSDGNGAWDSLDGANYHFAVGSESPYCHSTKTNEIFTSQIPFAAWDVINEAMRN
jgi:hypothetical protein